MGSLMGESLEEIKSNLSKVATFETVFGTVESGCHGEVGV